MKETAESIYSPMCRIQCFCLFWHFNKDFFEHKNDQNMKISLISFICKISKQFFSGSLLHQITIGFSYTVIISDVYRPLVKVFINGCLCDVMEKKKEEEWNKHTVVNYFLVLFSKRSEFYKIWVTFSQIKNLFFIICFVFFRCFSMLINYNTLLLIK
jgi:hypothetical protein